MKSILISETDARHSGAITKINKRIEEEQAKHPHGSFISALSVAHGTGFTSVTVILAVPPPALVDATRKVLEAETLVLPPPNKKKAAAKKAPAKKAAKKK